MNTMKWHTLWHSVDYPTEGERSLYVEPTLIYFGEYYSCRNAGLDKLNRWIGIIRSPNHCIVENIRSHIGDGGQSDRMIGHSIAQV